MSQRLSSQIGAVLLLALGIGSAAGGAAAAPTEAQQSAIRSSCQTDYRAHCASVSPGGAAALQCLQQNLTSLSPACQSAVSAASGATTPAQPAPAQATTQPTTTQPTTTQPTTTPPASDQATSGQPATPPQPTEAQLTALRSACPRDYGTYCGTVPAGGAAALQCLQKNVGSLSPSCRTAVEAVSPPPAPVKPTEAQLTAIRSACPRDYGTYCGDVPAGGTPALQCLQKNVASLSPSCKSAVEAVGGGAAPAAAAIQAPPAAPAQPTQAQQNAIKSACQHDYRAHCASVPAGGSAALQCLQKNAASLSPSCRQAVAAVGGGAATGIATTTTTAPAAPAAAPAQQPVIVMSPREEMMVMREACGPDYRAYCPGVRIMGGAALQCLMANSANLSGGCKNALAQFERRQ